MLKLTSVVTKYGRTTVLHGISVHVNKGEIVALVGANGAGKTTVLNTISGIVPRSKGSVIFDNQDIGKFSADRIVRIGLSQVPEGRHLFGDMSVRDNLLLGTYTRKETDRRACFAQDLARIYTIFPRLQERAEQKAGTLSGGGAADAGHRSRVDGAPQAHPL